MDAASPALSPRRARLRVVAGVVAVLVVLALSLQVSEGMRDRRGQGFCRRDVAGGEPTEELRWFPFGERCSVELPDGTVLVREQGWELTALVLAVGVIVVAGVFAGSAVRRRVALAVVVPTAASAALLLAIAPIRGVPRLVGLVTISVALGLVPGLMTAGGVWLVVRGNPRTTLLLSVTGWALAVVLAGQGGLADD